MTTNLQLEMRRTFNPYPWGYHIDPTQPHTFLPRKKGKQFCRWCGKSHLQKEAA